MDELILKSRSYLSWLPVLILTTLHKILKLLMGTWESFQLCSVEVWGPHRFIDITDPSDLSTDMEEFPFYHELVQCNDQFEADTNERLPMMAENSYDAQGQKPPVLEYSWCFHKKINLRYKGEWVQVERRKVPHISQRDFHFESIKFTSLKRNRHLLYEIINHAAVKAKGAKMAANDKIKIFKMNERTCSCCSPWEELGSPKPKRPLNSVKLAEGVSEKIVADLKGFIDANEWYYEREIPYRRGYLLYGPPGCGKSSLVRAIASEINYNICLLSLGAKDLTDYRLAHVLNSVPERSLILLEDVGAAFSARVDDEDTEAASSKELSFEGATRSTISFSGLLNALDGIVAAEGRIIFMTTNHVEKLDPALLRPGRIDMKICVDYPNDFQIKGLFNRILISNDKCDNDLAQIFVDRIRDVNVNNNCNVKVTMAMVQGLLIKFKDEVDPAKAIDYVDTYFQEQVLVQGKNNGSDGWDFYA